MLSQRYHFDYLQHKDSHLIPLVETHETHNHYPLKRNFQVISMNNALE